MTKSIDLKKTIYELVQEHQDISGIMHDLGFKDIVNPAMLNTAGRVMTIPTGAAMKKIDLNTIKDVFKAKGYEIKD